LKRNFKTKLKIPPWTRNAIATAARCGFISNQIWDECICSDVKQARLYSRLAILRKLGIIEFAGFHFFEYGKIFKLTDSGKRLARRLGHTVFEEPSENVLSLQENAFLLGHRLQKQNLVQEFFLKREINRSADLLELFNGRNLRNILPDIVVQLNVPREPFFMAIELDAQRKDPNSYGTSLKKYMEFKNINMVLILSRFEPFYNAINCAKKHFGYPTDKSLMVFGDLNDFLANPATTPIQGIEGVTNISELIQRLSEQRTNKLTAIGIKEWKKDRYRYRFENGFNSSIDEHLKVG
jgi:hypothetical protein